MKPLHGSLRTSLWVAALLAAFIVTHLPPGRSHAPAVSDKLLHFCGYMCLGLITFWRGSLNPNATGLKAILTWLGFLALYGILDEGTQPLANRACDLGDWFADLIGAATGLALGALWHRVTRGSS